MNNNQSIFEKGFDPVYQAGAILGLGSIIMLIGKGVASGGVDVTPRFAWLTSATFLLVFSVFNALFSLSAKNMMKYWGRSVYCFMGLAVLSGLLAWAISGLSIGEAGSYRWIYVVVTFGYLVFLTMMALMRRIVEFAQKEEWNHPRIRRKKRKRR